MATPLKDYFGVNLANRLAEEILKVHPEFPAKEFVKTVRKSYAPLELKDRVRLIAASLFTHLPEEYPKAIKILLKTFGNPNPKETGMFTNYHWLMPVGQFIESYGLNHPKQSLNAIYELTQRNTGEYAIRPYIVKYPDLCIDLMTKWSTDPSFHVRRLSSEGLRPKLPWAPKLDLFIDNYKPVFAILENLKTDPTKFVQKSVANHLNDYLKVNPDPAMKVLRRWAKSKNVNTQWIVKHAMRSSTAVGMTKARR